MLANLVLLSLDSLLVLFYNFFAKRLLEGFFFSSESVTGNDGCCDMQVCNVMNPVQMDDILCANKCKKVKLINRHLHVTPISMGALAHLERLSKLCTCTLCSAV